MKNITILGKSTYAVAVILDIIKLNHEALGLVQIISNISEKDNDSAKFSYSIPGLKLIEHYYTDWSPGLQDKYILGSIGKGRRQIFKFFLKEFGIEKEKYMDVIHPSSVIGSEVILGYGTHISPLSVIAPFTKLGDFVVINRQSSIGHHVELGDFVGINPGVTVSGLCRIGSNSIIGSGATILDQIKIGCNVTIGAGSVVNKDIPDNVIAYGVPAKVIRKKNS